MRNSKRRQLISIVSLVGIAGASWALLRAFALVSFCTGGWLLGIERKHRRGKGGWLKCHDLRLSMLRKSRKFSSNLKPAHRVRDRLSSGSPTDRSLLWAGQWRQRIHPRASCSGLNQWQRSNAAARSLQHLFALCTKVLVDTLMLDVVEPQVAVEYLDDPHVTRHQYMLVVDLGQGRHIAPSPDLEVFAIISNDHRVVGLLRCSKFRDRIVNDVYVPDTMTLEQLERPRLEVQVLAGVLEVSSMSMAPPPVGSRWVSADTGHQSPGKEVDFDLRIGNVEDEPVWRSDTQTGRGRDRRLEGMTFDGEVRRRGGRQVITKCHARKHLSRCLLMILCAVKKSAKRPNFEGPESMLTSSLGVNGGVVAMKFDRWLAEQQRPQAQIVQQSRLMQEETEHEHQRNTANPRGGGEADP